MRRPAVSVPSNIIEAGKVFGDLIRSLRSPNRLQPELPVGIENLTLNQVLSFTGFIDYGEVFVRNKQTGETNESITGGGGGIQMNLPKIKWFPASTFAAAYAVPLQGPNPPAGGFGTWYLTGMMCYTF